MAYLKRKHITGYQKSIIVSLIGDKSLWKTQGYGGGHWVKSKNRVFGVLKGYTGHLDKVNFILTETIDTFSPKYRICRNIYPKQV